MQILTPDQPKTVLFLDALIEGLKDNYRPNPDITILIPFVMGELELDTCVDRIMDLWSVMWSKETLKAEELPFKLGVILEIPRAFLVANKIASRKEMQLICFDGEALAEFVFGMSREDAGLYLVSPSNLWCYLYESNHNHSFFCSGPIYGEKSTRGGSFSFTGHSWSLQYFALCQTKDSR